MHLAGVNEIVRPPKEKLRTATCENDRDDPADLKTPITCCQMGGTDCGQCGCVPSMGLVALGHYGLLGLSQRRKSLLVSARIRKRGCSMQRLLSSKPNPQPTTTRSTSSDERCSRTVRSITLIDSTSSSEGELRRELVQFSRWLSRLGFVPGTSGNLSVRLDETRLLATPTGMSKFLLGVEDLVTVDLSGNRLAGSRRVTSEISMHLAVYQLRPQVRAIIHSHPPIATAFACAGRGLDQMLCQEAIMTLGVVPLAKYATTGTREVAASLLPFIRDHEAILLANHGAITYGESLLDAFMRMETVEHLAQVSLVAHQLGSATPMNVDQVAELYVAKAKYLHNAVSVLQADMGTHPNSSVPNSLSSGAMASNEAALQTEKPRSLHSATEQSHA